MKIRYVGGMPVDFQPKPGAPYVTVAAGDSVDVPAAAAKNLVGSSDWEKPTESPKGAD